MKSAFVIGVVAGLAGGAIVGLRELRANLTFRKFCVRFGFHFPAGIYKGELICICGLRGQRPWFDTVQFKWHVRYYLNKAFPSHRGREPEMDHGIYWKAGK